MNRVHSCSIRYVEATKMTTIRIYSRVAKSSENTVNIWARQHNTIQFSRKDNFLISRAVKGAYCIHCIIQSFEGGLYGGNRIFQAHFHSHNASLVQTLFNTIIDCGKLSSKLAFTNALVICICIIT